MFDTFLWYWAIGLFLLVIAMSTPNYGDHLDPKHGLVGHALGHFVLALCWPVTLIVLYLLYKRRVREHEQRLKNLRHWGHD